MRCHVPARCPHLFTIARQSERRLYYGTVLSQPIIGELSTTK